MQNNFSWGSWFKNNLGAVTDWLGFGKEKLGFYYPASTYSFASSAGSSNMYASNSVSPMMGYNNGVEMHPYASYGDIHMPTQHYFLGDNMTAFAEGNFVQRLYYDTVNSGYILGQYMAGRGVSNSTMKNLNGTYTSFSEGVLGMSSALTMVNSVGMSFLRSATTAVEQVFLVTKNGIALPKGASIPKNFVENPFRINSYGEIQNGKFIEKLRIDAATPRGMKGPSTSHFHLDGGKEHIFDNSRWPWWMQ